MKIRVCEKCKLCINLCKQGKQKPFIKFVCHKFIPFIYIDIDEEQRIMKLYGLSKEDFNKILIQQSGKCPICKTTFKERRDIHIDHSHNTGKVRGLLCKNCNHGLGNYRDDIIIHENAINYLKGYKLK